MEARLNTLRTMVGNPSDGSDWSDDILLTYLDIAGQIIIRRAFPFKDNVTDVPYKYNTLQCEIATYLLNKRGAEGETSHSENGISRSYENADIPESMLKSIIPYSGVI